MARLDPPSWLVKAAAEVSLKFPGARTALIRLSDKETPAQGVFYECEVPGDAEDAVVDILPASQVDDNSARQKILDVLAKAVKPMKRAAIARAAGLSVAGGFFGAAFSRLRKDKKIFQPDQTDHFWWLVGRELLAIQRENT